MKRNLKNILIILLAIFIVVICFIYLFGNNFKKIKQGKQDPLEHSPQREVKPLSGESAGENFKTVNVLVIVLDKNYNILIEKGNSVYQAMINLQKESNFSFNYKEYPSLGIFIDEINNIKGNDGKYWIYSVNGKEASVGVLDYILEEGDIIKWELK